MCELFAMSSRQGATVSFSFEEFSRRGGLTGPHGDGWGVAFFEGGDARVVREPAPASSSPCVRFIERYPIRSTLVLSHVRHATRGEVSLANTQPFARELGGRLHVFAHNGHLAGVPEPDGLPLGRFRPIGDTDSEHAFCALLARLEPLWLRDTGPPTLAERMAVVAEFAAALRSRGPANFLYTDAELLFAHGHERRQLHGRIEPPGLHLLLRHCPLEPGSGRPTGGVRVSPTDDGQEVLLLASVPLTSEAWQALAPGEIVVLSRGRLLARVRGE